MPIITGWVLTDHTGKQWTFEDFAYEGGLEAQKEYMLKLSSDLTLTDAEALIQSGSWTEAPIEVPE